MPRGIVGLLLLSCVGMGACDCGGPGEHRGATGVVSEAEPEEHEDPAAVSAAEARAEPEPEPREPADVARPAPSDGELPERGCLLVGGPTPVWDRTGPAAVIPDGDGFVVAGLARSEGEMQAFLVRLGVGGEVTRLGTRPLDRSPPDPVPPGLAAVRPGLAVLALLDGDGGVWLGDVRTDRPGPIDLTRVATGADGRFTPVVAARDARRWVAWTARGTPMRVKLAALAAPGEDPEVTDVTPPTMGASAPTFGRSPEGTGPDLYFVDARAGVSPIVHVPIARDGTPHEARVARPVGTVTTPPEIAVARGGGRTLAGYTVVGTAATTAVGLVRLDGNDGAAPVAIVPGTGYGRLHVSAASAPGAVLFAADAPQASPPESPREVHVRVADDTGLGPPLVLEGPGGAAEGAAIARNGAGLVTVTFRDAGAVHAARLRCDDARERAR